MKPKPGRAPDIRCRVLTVEIPEVLYEEVIACATESELTIDDFATAAISLYLLQEVGSREASRIYLDVNFGKIESAQRRD